MDHHPLQGTKIPNLVWFDKFLKLGDAKLGFGKYGERNYRWLIDNDLKYAQWVVMENAQTPRFDHDPFAMAARWLAEAFPLMQHPDHAFMQSFDAVVKAAKQKANEEERKRREDKRALKALRKSTANGQLALLPYELLMHILKTLDDVGHYFVGVNPILNLPQVCQELRRMLGPLTVSSARMTLMITGTFALLDPIKSKIGGGTRPSLKIRRADRVHIGRGVPNDIQYQRLWRHMKILASKTLIDIWCTELSVVRGSLTDYEALAARSMAQKSKFLALRESALLTMWRFTASRTRCEQMLRTCYYTGTFVTKDQHVPSLLSHVQLTDEVTAMNRERQSLINYLKEMVQLNTEHSLCLCIPSMFKTVDGEKKFERFLNPHCRP